MANYDTLKDAVIRGDGETIALLQEMGLRDKVKIIVGGVAATEEFAKSIGADSYAPDAGSAAQWAKQVIKRDEE